jgi:hypothetical protein
MWASETLQELPQFNISDITGEDLERLLLK